MHLFFQILDVSKVFVGSSILYHSGGVTL